MNKQKRIKKSKLFKFILIPTILIITIFSWTISLGKTLQFDDVNKAKFSELSVNEIEVQTVNDEIENNETEITADELVKKFEYLYKKVTREEKIFILTKFDVALQIYNCANKAEAEASYFYNGDLYMDNGDAFRHTYWNALMVKYVGIDDAKTFADAHESGDDSKGVDKEMDLSNNETGRNYGLEYLDLSDQEIAYKILNHVSKGDCVQILNKSILIESNIDGLKPQFLYEAVEINNNEIKINRLLIPEAKGITTIPDTIYEKNVTELGDYVFANNTIESLVLPKNIKNIGIGTFENCTNLRSISNLNNVENIGDKAFKNCAKLATIDNLSNLQNVGVEAFYNCSSINIDNSMDKLENIGNSAFENCLELTSINLPYLNNLGIRAFAGCGNLSVVNLSANTALNTISERAFENTAITDFVIPSGVNSIEDDAFLGTMITNFKSNANYMWQNNVLIKCNVTDTDRKVAIYANPLVSEITIPNSVTILNARLFKGNSNIKNINLNEVEHIGPEVFRNSSLANINNANNIIDCDITALLDTPWYSNNASEFVILGKVLLKYFGTNRIVKTPDNIHRIGKDCFDNSVTTQIILSNKIDSIGVSAFKGATALENIIFTSDIPPVLDGDCFDNKVILYTLESKVQEYKNNICFVSLTNTITAKAITINFYNTNGEYLGRTTEYYGSKFDKYITAPEIVGKDFSCWECKNQEFRINDIIEYYDDIDLVAKYQVAKYQIIIGDNEQTIDYNQTENFDIPEVPGKIFKGWFDKPLGGNKIIDSTKKWVYTQKINSNILYPQYDLIKYTITYNFGNADVVFDMPNEFTVDNPVFKAELTAPQKFGYLFVKWSYNGNKFDNTKGIFKDIVLVAEWEGRVITANENLAITDKVAIIDFSNASSSKKYTININSSVKMISFIGNGYMTITAKIKVLNRNGAILFGLKNIDIEAPTGTENHAIDCEGPALYLTYYGNVTISGGKGADGSGNGVDGSNGGYGIKANEVTLMAFNSDSKVYVYGGNGGNGSRGYDGEDGKDGERPPRGSIFKPIKGDDGEPGKDGHAGGNGGNGGYAIYASGNKINVTRGSKYYIRGGDGGDGGYGGNGGKGGNGADDISGDWFTGTGDPGDGGKGGNGGDNGVAGSAAQGTNCNNSLETHGGINGDDGEIGYAGFGGKGGDHGIIGNDGDDGKDGEKGRDGHIIAGPVGDLTKLPVDGQVEDDNSIVDLPDAFSNEFYEMFLQ